MMSGLRSKHVEEFNFIQFMWMNKKFVYQVGNNKKFHPYFHFPPAVQFRFWRNVGYVLRQLEVCLWENKATGYLWNHQSFVFRKKLPDRHLYLCGNTVMMKPAVLPAKLGCFILAASNRHYTMVKYFLFTVLTLGTNSYCTNLNGQRKRS